MYTKEKKNTSTMPLLDHKVEDRIYINPETGDEINLGPFLETIYWSFQILNRHPPKPVVQLSTMSRCVSSMVSVSISVSTMSRCVSTMGRCATSSRQYRAWLVVSNGAGSASPA